jgi:hypothetical protein
MKMLNKIIGGSSIAIAAVLAFSASTTQAQNLLVNPGFDFSGAGNFTPNPIYFSDTPTHVGTANSSTNHFAGQNQGWALFGSSQNDMAGAANASPLSPSFTLLVNQNAGSAWAANGGYQVVSINPGQEYTYEMSMLTPSEGSAIINGNFGTNLFYATPVDLALSFLNASGTTNGLAWGAGGVGGFNAAFTPTQTDQWHQGSVTSTAPAGAAYAIVYAMFMESGKQTIPVSMYFDNGSLVATPEPASLALVGMGLASFYLIRRRKS